MAQGPPGSSSSGSREEMINFGSVAPRLAALDRAQRSRVPTGSDLISFMFNAQKLGSSRASIVTL